MRIGITGVLIAVAVLAAACASVNPVPIRGPSGAPGYSMQCSGFGRNWDDCYKVAGEVCLSGYRIIQRSSESVAMPLNGGTVMAPKSGMVIECK